MIVCYNKFPSVATSCTEWNVPIKIEYHLPQATTVVSGVVPGTEMAAVQADFEAIP